MICFLTSLGIAALVIFFAWAIYKGCIEDPYNDDYGSYR